MCMYNTYTYNRPTSVHVYIQFFKCPRHHIGDWLPNEDKKVGGDNSWLLHLPNTIETTRSLTQDTEIILGVKICSHALQCTNCLIIHMFTCHRTLSQNFDFLKEC